MKNLLLVGCGKMGGALLEGWYQSLAEKFSFYVVDPHKNNVQKSVFDNKNVCFFQDIESLAGDIAPNEIHFDYVFLAIKPQMAKDALAALRQQPFIEKSIIVSIMAGIKINFLADHLKKSEDSIIRAMPNLPVSVGAGITAVFSRDRLHEIVKSDIEAFCTQVGKVVWLNHEDEMHIVTALSGSGPAYFYLLVESMVQAAIEMGLTSDVAEKLACQTFLGSALLQEDKNQSADILRKNVTSPGGTTQAALEKFMDNDQFKNLVYQALQAAAHRSEELSST